MLYGVECCPLKEKHRSEKWTIAVPMRIIATESNQGGRSEDKKVSQKLKGKFYRTAVRPDLRCCMEQNAGPLKDNH
jgi:hypothetical protein